jgi:hypothetical protein
MFLAAGCLVLREVPLTAYIPEGSAAVAFADLARLRATPLYARLPVPDALHDASEVMVVYDGKDWAIAARGDFRQPPAGATNIAPGIAAMGAPEMVRAMGARPRAGQDLLAHAPTGAPVWLVARGNVSLPLTGNLANLNRLLRQAEYTSIAMRPGAQIEIDATALCATPERARHLEENIRALASLARVEAITVTGEGTTVHVRAAVSPNALP